MNIERSYKEGLALNLMPRAPHWAAKIALSIAFTTSHVAGHTFSPPISRVELDIERIIIESNIKFPTASTKSTRDIAQGLFEYYKTAENRLTDKWHVETLQSHILRIYQFNDGCLASACFEEKNYKLHFPYQDGNVELALAILERRIVGVHMRIPAGSKLNSDDILFALEGESVDPLFDVALIKEFFLNPAKGIGILTDQERAFKIKLDLIPPAKAADEINERLKLLTQNPLSNEALNLLEYLGKIYSGQSKDKPALPIANISCSISLLKSYLSANIRNADAVKRFCKILINFSEALVHSKILLKDIIYYLLEKTHGSAPYEAKESRLALIEIFYKLIDESHNNNPDTLEILDVFYENALDLLLHEVKTSSKDDRSKHKPIKHLARLFSLTPSLELLSRNLSNYQQMIIDSLFNFAQRVEPRLLSATGVIHALELIWESAGNGRDKRLALTADFRKKLLNLRNSFYSRANYHAGNILEIKICFTE